MNAKKRTTTFLLLGAALLMGACAGDEPSASDLAAEARETAGDAADRAEDLAQQAGEAAGDAADQAEDVAQDIGDGPDSGTPSISIESPADGATVSASEVKLKVATTGVTIVAADGDTSGSTAHFHVFIDREPVAEGETIPKEEGIIHSTDNPIPVPGLSPGKHTLTVVYGDGNHTRIHGDAADSVELTVS